MCTRKLMGCAKKDHGAKFAPEKYDLMHMTRLPKYSITT